MESAVNVAELRALAKAAVEAADWAYYEGGSEEEATLRRNEEAYREVRLWPRCLVDVSDVRLGVELFGRKLPLPFGLAPVAMQRLAHDDGEAGAARACAAQGVLYCAAQQATTSLEDIAKAAGLGPPRWFQLYVLRDRDVTRSLVERAERAGCEVLAVTVDSPVLGRREQDQRNRFVLRKGLTMANFKANSAPASPPPKDAQATVATRIGNRDAGLDWEALRALRTMTKLPIVLKGVLRYDDASRAADEGYGVWVSNHGGRQLDQAPGTLEALPEVVAGVKGRVPVLFDGGLRRGTDMLKALALGADFCFVGRPLVWALGAGGEAGVTRLLAMLETELRTSMALLGCADVRQLSRDLVQMPWERPHRLPLPLQQPQRGLTQPKGRGSPDPGLGWCRRRPFRTLINNNVARKQDMWEQKDCH